MQQVDAHLDTGPPRPATTQPDSERLCSLRSSLVQIQVLYTTIMYCSTYFTRVYASFLLEVVRLVLGEDERGALVLLAARERREICVRSTHRAEARPPHTLAAVGHKLGV